MNPLASVLQVPLFLWAFDYYYNPFTSGCVFASGDILQPLKGIWTALEPNLFPSCFLIAHSYHTITKPVDI